MNKKNLNTDILEKIEKSDIFTENYPEIVNAFRDIFNLKFYFFVENDRYPLKFILFPSQFSKIYGFLIMIFDFFVIFSTN